MRFLLLAPVLLAFGHIAMAADAASAPAGAAPQSVAVTASAPAEPEQPKLICHQESAIGSMMTHKVCTRVQSESERNAMQEAMRQNLPNNSIAHPAPGGAVH